MSVSSVVVFHEQYVTTAGRRRRDILSPFLTKTWDGITSASSASLNLHFVPVVKVRLMGKYSNRTAYSKNRFTGFPYMLMTT